ASSEGSASTPAPAAAAAAAAPAAPGGMDAAGIRNIWPQLMTALRKFTGGRSLEAMLTQATVASVEGNALTLTHKSEPLARRLSDQDNARKIAGALTDVLGGDWQVRCVHGNAPVAAAARPQQAAPAPERSFTRQSATAAPPAEPAARPATPPPPPPRPKVTTSEPDIPLPPEPADEDDEDLYNEDASPAPPPPPPPPDKDPDELARKLLSEHLGARPLD
ncbi:DNA polymerase III subunit gamma/tau, partial [Amycolatopsis sp. NPDC058278]